MKKLSLITRISITIFLIIAFLTLLLAIPVYRRLETIVDRYTEKVCKQVTDYTGLKLSYGSISPSVLAYLGVKNLSVSDNQERKVIEIKTVHIKYKLLPLLKAQYDSILKGISVDGVDVDLLSLIDYLISIYSSKTEESSADINLIYDRINMVMDYIPQNVSVKNVNLKYKNDSIDSQLLVKETKLLNSQNKASIDFSLKSAVNFAWGRTIKTKGDISLSGSVTKELDGSFIKINLANFVQDRYKLNKINFLLSYNDRKFDLHTVQNVIPMDVQVSYALENKILDAAVKTEKLTPVSVFSSVGNDFLAKVLKGSSLSVNAGLSWNLDTKNLKYFSDGSILAPDCLIPGSAQVSYDLSGNESRININSFNVSGKNCDAGLELSLVYKTLQLSGIADLRQYILPNGTVVSSELYFDPLNKAGFMLFSPQVFIGDRAFTAMQASVMPQSDSIDYTFEINDFSHMEDGTPGVIKADGSYLSSSKYIQTSLSLSSLYLDSILGVTGQLVPQNNAGIINKAADACSDYVFSGDAYFSTDFNSVSYNVPYIVLANSKRDNQLLLLALNGNNQSIQLNRFNMIYGAMALEATASFDTMPGSSDKFYTADIISSSIPYHISGTIMPEVITLSGDYGIEAEFRKGKNNTLEGFANCAGIPFKTRQSTFTVSMDSAFDYDNQQGPHINLTHFQIEKDVPDSSINPRLEISGSGTKYGAQINSISYTDLYSSLTGNSDITVNIDGKVFNSAGIQLNLKDPRTDERLVMEASVSNPDAVILTGDNIFNSLYVNAMAQISNFSLNRFMNVKNDNNELTAGLYVSGTLEHPYATASVERLSFLLNNEIVTSSGSILLEERDLTVNDFTLKGQWWDLKDVNGKASLNDFSGSLSAMFNVNSIRNIEMPLELTIEDSYVPDGYSIPQSFTARLSCKNMGGTLFKKPVPFDISLNYTKDFLSFYSSDNLGILGTYSTSDGLYASWKMGNTVSMDITGNFNSNDMFIKLSNVNVDLNRFFHNANLDDLFIIDQGILKGSATMRGSFSSPDFKGALSVSNPVFQLPFLFSQKISTDKILLTATNNEFTIADSVYRLKNTPKFKMNSHMFLNKWSPDHLDVNIATLEKQSVPIKFKSPIIKLDADTECDFSMVLENNTFDFSGSVFAENLTVVSDISELSNRNTQSSGNFMDDWNITTDLNIRLGTHSSLNFNPLLRCVFVPHTTITCKIDTSADLYQLDGNLQLRSGDVAYLSRNFYIKEGNIKFNPTDIANPLITIRAETREKDSQGENVRIILSAENQYLLDFNPRFSSVPPKSENEIRLMMGQIVLADSSNVGNLFLSAGEYYLQSTVVRDIENKLRDLLNFDIFSVRTNILQNTISLSTQRNRTKELSIGNFFDNSTVYIGKYIGSALYVDAMLNMTASNYMDADYLPAGNLLFQPEFGLELELPVINIRWDMTWDLDPSLKFKSYVPDTSLSLSWKFSF